MLTIVDHGVNIAVPDLVRISLKALGDQKHSALFITLLIIKRKPFQFQTLMKN